jgi:hypothetical protein
MPAKLPDGVLVTDDGHLREAVARHRRVGGRLQSVSPSELSAGETPRARQVWIDLDTGAPVPEAAAGTFYPQALSGRGARSAVGRSGCEVSSHERT